MRLVCQAYYKPHDFTFLDKPHSCVHNTLTPLNVWKVDGVDVGVHESGSQKRVALYIASGFTLLALL